MMFTQGPRWGWSRIQCGEILSTYMHTTVYTLICVCVCTHMHSILEQSCLEDLGGRGKRLGLIPTDFSFTEGLGKNISDHEKVADFLAVKTGTAPADDQCAFCTQLHKLGYFNSPSGGSHMTYALL